MVSIIFYLIYTFTHLENDKCQKETGFKYDKNPVLGSVYTNNYGCLFLKERNIGENYFYHRIVIILEKSSLPLILFLLALSVANILKIHRIKFKPWSCVGILIQWFEKKTLKIIVGIWQDIYSLEWFMAS